MKILRAVAVAAALCVGSLAAAGDEKPQALTPAQQEVLRQTLGLPPGSKFEIELTTRDEGTLKTHNKGEGVGAASTSEGDGITQTVDGTPPSVNGVDGGSAQGGGIKSKGVAKAFKPDPSMWSNPLLWFGVLCLAGAGACAYMGTKLPKLMRWIIPLVVAGIAFIAAAVFPAILIWAVVIGGLFLLVPHLKAISNSGSGLAAKEALRAVTAGVEDKDVPAEAQAAVKAAIARAADDADKKVIDKIKQADKIGKYAE